jgi:hypothetical protein
MDGNRRGNGVANGNEFQWMWRRAPGFMDVVAYEGNGVAGREIPHNLGVAPELIIIKQRNAVRSWAVYNSTSGTGKFLKLEGSAGEVTQSGVFDTAPTESLFTVETNTYVNISGGNYIAYLFASVPGISKVGSYTGNGSEVEVDCGFTNGARWLLIKRTDSAGDWYFTSNPNNFKTLSKLNTTDYQVNHMSTFNDVPSGFRVVQYSANELCVDGAEYIFYAIA